MTDQRIVMYEGDTLPELECSFEDVDEEGTAVAVNLTGYGAITLHVNQNGDVLVKTATVTDAAAGEFKFAFAADDLEPGTHQSEIQLIDADEKIMTFAGPTVEVLADLA